MKCIVTGGAGFIGSHLVDRLVNMGHEVIILDDLSSGREENLNDKATFRQIDIASWDEVGTCKEDFNGCDVIFHNAASKKLVCIRDPARDLAVNAGGTLILLQMAAQHNVPRFIGASTGSVYGEVKEMISEITPTNPVSYYGVSKLAGENYINIFHRDTQIKATILRYFHVYGARQRSDTEGGVVAVFSRQIGEGGPITIHGNGDQIRVFTHVNDVVEANIRAWLLKKSGTYNCCNTEQKSVYTLAKDLEKAATNRRDRIPLEYQDRLPGDIDFFSTDNSLICETLGMSFTPYKVGIYML